MPARINMPENRVVRVFPVPVLEGLLVLAAFTEALAIDPRVPVCLIGSALVVKLHPALPVEGGLGYTPGETQSIEGSEVFVRFGSPLVEREGILCTAGI